MPSLAAGLTSCTAWASTCAAECRSTARPSGESMVTASTTSPVGDRQVQVPQLAVHPHDDDVAALGEQVRGGGPRLDRDLGAVDGEGEGLGGRCRHGGDLLTLVARPVRTLATMLPTRRRPSGGAPAPLGRGPCLRAARPLRTRSARRRTHDGPGQVLTGAVRCGRYWVRTSDLLGVNEALYH